MEKKLEELERVLVKFSNPDIEYLTRRIGLDHRCVGRALRIFGEQVVLEALRRFAGGFEYAPKSKEHYFIGVCRAVEATG